jgi:hypothetical protein
MTARSFDQRWADAVRDELGARAATETTAPAAVLTGADLEPLPAPVRRYVAASGALGRPVPQSMRLVADALMRRKPGETGMPATSTQVNVFGHRPVRLFLMRARMFGLPVRALHLYRGDAATFQVRVAGLATIVDLAGDEISRAETVTVLNDLCALAPGAIPGAGLAWEAVDDRTAAVTFANGRWTVRATLLFNERDELVDFRSDDRPEHADGKLVPRRWSTPLSDYRVIGGMRLPGRGLAVYERPDGPFTYGEFTVRSIDYDVAEG